MKPPANLWEQLEAELYPRLTIVGFRPIDFPATPPPETTGIVYTAFEAPYALLFCVRIHRDDFTLICAATTLACETMRVALAKAGASDWTRDGYVLAAIQTPPSSTETKQCLCSFEQSRSICRRHAIWPEPHIARNGGNPWISRLDRVTVLALPENEAPEVPTEPPASGPRFIEDIHARLKSGASYKHIAEEAVRTAREREDFYAS
jgi:hypothetical protein